VDSSTGIVLLVIAAVLAVLGLVVMTGALSWFGRLPGDIHMSGKNVTFFAPVVSMLLLSVVLSVVLGVINRLR
jgi:hypothetical protein